MIDPGLYREIGCHLQAGSVCRLYEITSIKGKMNTIRPGNWGIIDSDWGISNGIDGDVDNSSKIDGSVVVEEGAQVRGSVLRGPLVIGRNTLIQKSYVGPFTSIYHDVVIQNSELEHSIILENSRIMNLGHRMERSLVGKNVEIVQCGMMPKAYRFMVGDASRIEVP